MISKDVEGKTVDELSDIIPREAIAEIKKRYQQCVDTGTQIEYEEMIPMLGKDHWWLTTLTPQKNDSGEIFRIIGSAIEISELKNTQQLLEDHKTNLEKLVEEKQSELIVQNNNLQKEIEEKAAIEEELRASNGILQQEIEERASIEEELKTSNELLEEEIVERKKTQQLNEKLIFDLGERVKEMRCINKINQFIEDDRLTIQQILEKTVQVIPTSFRLPTKTFCRIKFNDQVFESNPFKETGLKEHELLYNNELPVGFMEVFLDMETSGFDSVFLEEETNLIDNIAGNLSQAITKIFAINELEENEKKFHKFFNEIPYPLCHVDESGRFIEANKSFTKHLGYALDDVPNIDAWWRKAYPDSEYRMWVIENWNRAIEKSIETGESIEPKVYEVTCKNGETKKFIVGGITIGKEVLTTLFDVSEREKYEADLQNALNFNTSVVQDSPIGKAVYDKSGQCIMANKKAAEFVGASVDQILKQNFNRIESWKKSGLVDAANTILENGGTDKKEIHVKSSFGKDVWLECHFTRFFQNNEPHLLFIYNDISESRFYQEELKESQQRFKLATEGANAGIWDWKPGTNEVFYSKIWKQHVGYEDHELKSEFTTWEKLLHPDDSERMHRAVENYLKNPRGRFIEEFRMRHKNGTYRWIRNEAASLKNEQGNIVRMFGVHTDITEKKEAEEALKESEERHRLIFESVNDAIFICNENGRIVEINPAGCRIYGYSKDEFLELDPHKLLHEDWQHELDRFFKTCMAGKKYTSENVEYTSSGEIMHTQVYGSPLEFKGQKHIMAVVRDITSLKNAQEDLEHSREQLQLITDLIPVLVSYLKPDHRYEFVNKGYENWFGTTAADVVGKHAKDIIGEEAYQITKQDLDRVFAGETVEYERMMPYKHGKKRYTQTTFLPHKKGNKVEGAIVCVNDVTPLKEKQNELRKLLEELERSNKELEQFAYIASHDLQEPLRMVSSFLQLLERKYNEKLDDDGREFIRYAVDGASRMKTLINDLLKFSRVGTRGKPFTNTIMNQVINQVLTNLSDTIKESGARFVLGKLPEIDADESQMVQLFQNLVSNAIKFRGDKTPQISISAKENKKQVTFTVSDNGIGIEPKFHERIFIIFKRLHTSDKYPGTGIGLAVCKKIVDRHHGTISLKSAPGKGTSFKIIIPKHLQTMISNNEGPY